MARTIPRPMIDCIATAREPTIRDLCAVADHIRADLGGLAWSTPARQAALVLSMRAAHAALTGCPAE